MDASRSSSASACPGCGKPLDPLRAGHVAILEGGFRYFCGPECKLLYVDVASKRISLEALTAEPPSVAPPSVAARSVAPPSVAPPSVTVSGVTSVGARSVTIREVTEPSPVHVPSFPSPSSSPSPVSAARASVSPRSAPAAEDEAPPATLRSGDPASDDPASVPGADPAEEGEEAVVEAQPPSLARPRPEPVPLRASVAAAAPVVGIAFGVAAFVVSLAGAAGAPLRLPFAALSLLVLVVTTLLAARDPSEPGSGFVIGPVLLAAAGALLSLTTHDPHAEAHVAFVGLASASVLLVMQMITWSRRDVAEARARILAGLDVTVRVVTGAGEGSEEIAAAAVKPGEQVVIEAGEVVGVDGIVTGGEAEVAPWLDSPVVLVKREGDPVVAGATVLSGRLRVTSTFAGGDRAWVRLHQLASARIDVASPLVVLARQTAERGAPIAALLVGGATYANNGTWPDVLVAASAGA
ncbi:MAG: Lead, cadmium, zinc and mercury transporting ATPase, partial [Labilithrix sp.]|nr:Lead, cadmium, zinc and mercury transporting ATPase [Labilithrix sp.]